MSKKTGKTEKKTGQIRRVRDQGGSAMVAIPPAFQDLVELYVGVDARVELKTDKDGSWLRVSRV